MIPTPPPEQPQEKFFIGVAEAALLLNLPEGQVRGMVHAGTIPPHCYERPTPIGGRIYFRRYALIQWAIGGTNHG